MASTTKPESCWIKNSNWKERYSKLYSAQGNLSISKPEEVRRISFLADEPSPISSSLRSSLCTNNSVLYTKLESAELLKRLSSIKSHEINSLHNSNQSDNLGGHDTLLLEMVRARNREAQDQIKDQTLDLPRDDVSDEINEPCVHNWSIRMTERSMSRSRVSRTSTRRDLDIHSILAFNMTATAPSQSSVPIGIPGIGRLVTQGEDIPRWSIRRSVCPVCSQKWKDRSSVRKVKYSGLKRNSSAELPSVIAPARLRTSITKEYGPRPLVAALDEETGLVKGGLRNTSAHWQLTRARRFRLPKTQLPPEATAPPPHATPLARKDLDLRVNRFLADEEF